MQDLTSCLQAIAADSEVHIVRIKNRLDLLFDEETSAGYRDLALNLRISTEWTRSLGLEEHVCELQLILKAFAEVKVGSHFLIFIGRPCVSLLQRSIIIRSQLY
jgi:hypothetical protein